MLEQCSLISDMDVRYDSEQRIVIVNNCLVRFTRTEYKLVHLLLTHQVASDTELYNALSLQTTNKLDAKTFAKYIDKIRCKIISHAVGLYRVNGYGYMLLIKEDVETGKASHDARNAGF